MKAIETNIGTSKPRGFASMDQSKQREIARKGGKAAHEKGTAHEFTSDEARAAGKKGGEAVSRNRAHMSAIGQRGGQQSAGGRRTRQQHVSAAESSNDTLTLPSQAAAFERPAHLS